MSGLRGLLRWACYSSIIILLLWAAFFQPADSHAQTIVTAEELCTTPAEADFDAFNFDQLEEGFSRRLESLEPESELFVECGFWIAFSYYLDDELVETTTLAEELVNFKGVFFFLSDLYWLIGQSALELGAIELRAEQYDAAKVYFERALEYADLSDDPELEGNAHNLLGHLYSDTKAIDRAESHYLSAVAAAKESDDRESEMIYLQNLGYTVEPYPQIIDYLSQSLLIAEELNDKVTQAELREALGYSYYNQGYNALEAEDIDGAVDLFTQALQYATDINDLILKHETLNQIGNLYATIGEYEQATESYTEALAIAEQLEDRESRMIYHSNLGNVELDFDEAIKHLLQAEILAHQLNDEEMVNSVQLDLGYIHLLYGMELIGQDAYRKAIQELEKGLERSKTTDDLWLIETTYANLAIAFDKQNRSQSAESAYHQAIFYAQEQENNDEQVLDYLQQLATIFSSAPKEIDYYQQAIELAQRIEDKETEQKLHIKLAKIYREMAQESQTVNINRGLEQRTIDLYKKAVDYAQLAGDDNLERNIHNDLGLLYKETENIEEATRHLLIALTLTRELRGDQRESEMTILYNLGATIKSGEQSRQYYSEALAIAEALNDPAEEKSIRIELLVLQTAQIIIWGGNFFFFLGLTAAILAIPYCWQFKSPTFSNFSLRNKEKENARATKESEEARQNFLRLLLQMWVVDWGSADGHIDIQPRLDLHLSDQDPTPVHFPDGINQIMEQVEHKLFILGNAGSGKTWLLIRFLKQLIQQATDDNQAPIPILIPATPWVTRQPLSSWVQEQLWELYRVPPQLTQKWWDEKNLMLLIDDFQAISSSEQPAFLTELKRSSLPFIITTNAFATASFNNDLKINGGLIIHPFNEEQQVAYLAQTNAADLHPLIQSSDSLSNLATSPGMLQLISSMDKNQLALHKSEATPIVYKQILDSYLWRKSKLLHPTYTQQKVKKWLHWLSWQTGHFGKLFATDFSEIERISVPKKVVTRFKSLNDLPKLLLYPLIFIGPFYYLFAGKIATKAYGWISNNDKDKNASGENSYMGRTYQFYPTSLGIRWIGVNIVVILMWLYITYLHTMNPTSPTRSSWHNFWNFLTLSLLLTDLYLMLRPYQAKVKASVRNENRIKQLRNSSLRIGVVAGGLYILFHLVIRLNDFYTMDYIDIGRDYFMAIYFSFAIFLGASYYFGLKELFHHYSLRFLLSRENYIPFKINSFYQQATTIGILKQVGAHFLFANRFVMESAAGNFTIPRSLANWQEISQYTFFPRQKEKEEKSEDTPEVLLPIKESDQSVERHQPSEFVKDTAENKHKIPDWMLEKKTSPTLPSESSRSSSSWLAKLKERFKR